MGQPELKPCQAAVRGKIRWKESFQDEYFVCEAYCKKYERHASERISKKNLDGFVALLVERDVMHELCKGCKECPYYPLYEVFGCKLARAKDALALIQQFEAQVPRWISVEERLPEEGKKVAFIPSCNPGSVYVGALSNIGKSGGVMFSHREGRYTSNYYAKYWMPLPEPPEA